MPRKPWETVMVAAMEDDTETDTDHVLAVEREHLAKSREYLELMRQDVLSLPALAGDRVSQEYLKADLHRRAESLRDLPDTPLFFGRLDYASAAVLARGDDPPEPPAVLARGDDPPEPPGVLARGDDPPGPPHAEEFHVGRRHVHDPDGHPVVIDWRAPVSRPFYRASQADPMNLARRRRFGFNGGQLTAYEDELFTRVRTAGRVDGPAAEPAMSRIMIEEIERPRSGAMRDIVATIQPEQDDIVRADATLSVCVQGAPGTGKTAVGLHRVAFLLYAYRERMSRGGVLVLGPNRAFLTYIRNVLPALGEFDATQTSVTELLATVPIRGVDSELTASIKGDARMAEVLKHALWERLREPAEAIMLARGSRRWRISTDRLAGLVAELRERGVRYGTGRDMLSHRIAHVILTQMEAAGETCDDRTHEAVRRTSQVKTAVNAIWPKADPVRVVFDLLGDPQSLARSADGVLSDAEQQAIVWAKPPRSPGSARWSAADAVLIDEVTDLIARTASLAHIVVDEAQDLSAMACRAIGRRATTGSVTVLGDIAQGTTAWAARSWEQMLGDLGKPETALEILNTGYRVPRQILDFASRLLTLIAPDLEPARSIRQDAGSLAINAVSAGDLDGALARVCAAALALPGSVAVITADSDAAKAAQALREADLPHAVLDGEAESAQLTVVPVGLAKGLEFDHVIVVEPATIADAEARGLQRLYVALTRAVSRLTILHTRPLPEPLLS
ncbi:MAG TPA: ATP-binding domain-containing protein [Streptosporangiaceae bacterium]|nr:ATP-binding domain-containing protein [Streptosporangiaceae bacterium]